MTTQTINHNNSLNIKILTELYNDFSKNQSELFTELDKTFPKDPELLKAQFLVSCVTNETKVEKFIRNVMPYKQYIDKMDENFFLKHGDEVFPIFKKGHFQGLWKSGKLDTDAIWDYFKVLVFISDKCITCNPKLRVVLETSINSAAIAAGCRDKELQK